MYHQNNFKSSLFSVAPVFIFVYPEKLLPSSCFSFAALTGHDAAIAEAARLTDERPILDESVKQEISDILQLTSTDSNLVLNIVYFVPDSRKAGGACIEITGRIKKHIPHEKQLIMNTGTRIPVEEIVDVSIYETHTGL